MQAYPYVVTALSDVYDARYVDVAHVYRDPGPYFDRPYPDNATIAIGSGVLTE